MVYLLLILIIIIYLISIYPRYYWFLPSLPFYPNNSLESQLVYQMTQQRGQDMESFFYLTDESVSNAFLPYTHLNKSQLEKLILQPKIIFILLFLKYFINRARPWQVDTRIRKLSSTTGKTPAYPAGHALQAYYLYHILSRSNPELKDVYYNIAMNCDECRIKAGIHYPSDGKFSRQVVDLLVKLKIY